MRTLRDEGLEIYLEYEDHGPSTCVSYPPGFEGKAQKLNDYLARFVVTNLKPYEEWNEPLTVHLFVYAMDGP